MVHEREKTMKSETVGGIGKDILNNIPNYPNTIKGRELARVCSLTSSATVRREVNALRTAGFPIISTQNGYSIATDSYQIEECIRSLRSRVESIEEAIYGLYKSFGAVAQ